MEPFIMRYGVEPDPEREEHELSYSPESEMCIPGSGIRFALTSTRVTDTRTDTTSDEAGDR
jgi:hypothetical protein